MDFKNIEAFLKVVETGSFSTAAEALFITQPTISLRIQKLEDELKTKLFQRVSGKKVVLTPAGQTVLPYYREAYLLVEKGNKSVYELNNTTRKLVIASPNHMGKSTLSELLKVIHNEYPDIDITIKLCRSVEIVNQLEKGEIDIGIIYMGEEEVQDNKNFKVVQVSNEETVLTCSPDHPLAKIPELNALHLKNERIILYRKTFINVIKIDKFLKQNGLENYKTIEIQNLEWIKMMVRNGLGIAFFQKVIVQDELKEKNLISLPLKPTLPTTPISIIFHEKIPETIEELVLKASKDIFQTNL